MSDINNWIKGNLYGSTQKKNEFISFETQKINIPGTSETSLEVIFGCDGTNHAFTIHQIWVHNGRFEYASHITEQLLHKCNGSCIGKKSKGFFIIKEK